MTEIRKSNPYSYNDIPVITTFHPSYLSRNPKNLNPLDVIDDLYMLKALVNP